jgi:hypothetical protein
MPASDNGLAETELPANATVETDVLITLPAPTASR